MNVFEPFRTYSSPRRSAVVFIRATSEPASGSLSPNEQRIGSSRSGGSHVSRCSSDPERSTGPAPRPFARIDVPMPEQPQYSSSPTSMPSNAGQAETAERLGDVQVHQAELVRLRDDVDRMRRVLVVLGRLRPDLLLGELARERAELLLLRRQGERDPARHARLKLRHGAFCSCVD